MTSVMIEHRFILVYSIVLWTDFEPPTLLLISLGKHFKKVRSQIWISIESLVTEFRAKFVIEFKNFLIKDGIFSETASLKEIFQFV
jgi:hypothetical protein